MALTIDRFRGCLFGLATGDALGATVQFIEPGDFQPLVEIVGGGSFSLQPGEWTDDTSMALCLAESLIECRGFNPLDQMERYLRWYRHGYMSCKRYAFDIGAATRAALERFELTRDPFCGIDPQSAGNGSLMRLAPVAMAFASRPEEAIVKAGVSSRTTHGAVEAADACRYFAGLLVGALNGASKKELLSESYCPIHGYWKDNPLSGVIAEIGRGSYKHKQPPEIKNDGWVVKTLEAALWGFYHTTSFEEGCLNVVNQGYDADSVGAVYGQIAGAHYGEMNIPESWRTKLAKREIIEEYAVKLYEIAVLANA